MGRTSGDAQPAARTAVQEAGHAATAGRRGSPGLIVAEGGGVLREWLTGGLCRAARGERRSRHPAQSRPQKCAARGAGRGLLRGGRGGGLGGFLARLLKRVAERVGKARAQAVRASGDAVVARHTARGIYPVALEVYAVRLACFETLAAEHA